MDAHYRPLPPLPPQPPQPGLVACSICLRVLRGSTWVEAEEAIRELRSFEHRTPIRLGPALCDDCSDELADRRGDVSAAAA